MGLSPSGVFFDEENVRYLHWVLVEVPGEGIKTRTGKNCGQRGKNHTDRRDCISISLFALVPRTNKMNQIQVLIPLAECRRLNRKNREEDDCSEYASGQVWQKK